MTGKPPKDTPNDNKPHENLPPLDEQYLSARLVALIDALEQLGLGLCKIVIDFENIHSELLLRQLKREGRDFVADEFGKKE